MNKQERIARLYNRLVNAGFSFDGAVTLRRIEMTLSRWAEHECNGNIQRDGENSDGKPRWYSISNQGNIYRGSVIADRERGALKRLQAIMAGHPDFLAYHQGDPRGCALYVVPVKELRGQDIGGVYNRGIAVCE